MRVMKILGDANKMVITYVCGKKYHVTRPSDIQIKEGLGGGFNVNYNVTERLKYQDRVEMVEKRVATTSGDVAAVTLINNDNGDNIKRVTTFHLRPVTGE